MKSVMKHQKKMVSVVLKSYMYTVDDLSEFISMLQEDKTEFSKTHTDLKIDMGYNRGYYDSVDMYANLIGYREETDIEFEKRIKEEDNRINRQKDYELQQYEALKKKFG